MYFPGDSRKEGTVYLAYAYNLSALDPDYDLQGFVKRGYTYEKNNLLTLINDKREEMDMSQLTYYVDLEAAAQAVAEKSVADLPSDENGKRDLTQLSIDENDMNAYIMTYVSNCTSCYYTTTAVYSRAANMFTGSNPFYENPEKLGADLQEDYADNPFLGYDEFNEEMVYFGVGIVFEETSRQYVWIILTCTIN
ncbi:MAG: hypothetical protein LUC50_08700 [Ruminococcus sp.]|nr:hypothetical protein [Ruminococcus sp.]